MPFLWVQLLKFLVGPTALLVVYVAVDADGTTHGAKIALGTLAWMVAWWLLRPAPWGITALVPLVIFPLSDAMSIAETAALYGQGVFFWIMGLSLLAFAMEKHGLAKRFALSLLTTRVVGDTTSRILFFFMVATACVSMFISDGSTVAIMLPIGLSIHAYIMHLARQNASIGDGKQLRTFFVLGTLYAAVAGGIGTMIGMPHSAAAMAQLEALTGTRIGWFTWMQLGIPIAVSLLLANYFLLRFFFKPEVTQVPGGRDFLLAERLNLGKMSLGEKSVLTIFLAMAALFAIPPILPGLLGPDNAFASWLNENISVWMVPPFVMLMLFLAPSDVKNRQSVLSWDEANERISWGVLLMVTSAVAVVDALSRFGFTDVMTRTITDTGAINGYALPFVTGLATSTITNFMSGVATSALVSAVMIPIAQSVDFSTIAITIMVPATAMGIIFPWAGPTVGTAFGVGKIEIKDLMRVGVVAEIIMIVIAASWCLLLEPLF